MLIYSYLYLSKLQDGFAADSPTIGTFCGFTMPEPVQTSGNQLRVVFTSDGSSSGRGFHLTWNAIPLRAVIATPAPTNVSDTGDFLIDPFLSIYSITRGACVAQR